MKFVCLPVDPDKGIYSFIRVDSIVAILDTDFAERVEVHYSVGAERRTTTVKAHSAAEVMRSVEIEASDED